MTPELQTCSADIFRRHEIKSSPVSEAETDFLAEIFAELIRNSLSYRKEDNNEKEI